MNFIKKYVWYVVGLVVIVVGGFLLLQGTGGKGGGGGNSTVPDLTEISSGNFSFAYPTVLQTKEYAPGVVSVGGVYKNAGFISLVDVVHYKSDLQSATPASFDAYMKKQALAFCGSDSTTTAGACSNPTEVAYTSPSGVSGFKLTLAFSRKNPTTGKTEASTYGPIYVFNTSKPPATGEKLRYEGVFIYPTFSTYLLLGTSSPDVMNPIVANLKIQK
jgi:hypothetical protein